MDPHKLLRDYLEENFNQYDLYRKECYHNDPKFGGREFKGKYISFEFNKDDYDKLTKFDKATIGNVKFTKMAASVERIDVIELLFKYEYTDNKTYSSDITGGGKKYGYIDPEGKFYECGYAGHNNLEYNLRDRGLINESPWYGVDAPEYWGWLKLSGAAMTECEFIFKFEVKESSWRSEGENKVKELKITKAQYETMKSYIESLGRRTVNFNFSDYKISDLVILPEIDAEAEWETLYNLRLKV